MPLPSGGSTQVRLINENKECRPVASPVNATEIPASGSCCNQRRLAPVALSHSRLTRSSMEQPIGHGVRKVPHGHIGVYTNPIPGPNAGTGWRREALRPC